MAGYSSQLTQKKYKYPSKPDHLGTRQNVQFRRVSDLMGVI